MRRLVLLVVVGLTLLGLGAEALLAQEAAQEEGAQEEAAQEEVAQEEPARPLPAGWSGPGFYLSLLKLLASWLLFLLWVYTTDWVSRDGQEMKLDYFRWNPLVFGPFVAAFVLLWLIPFFWIGFPFVLIAYAVPLTLYIRYRNPKVAPHQTVLTRDHLRFWFAERLALVGIKIEKEKKDPHTTGPPVILASKGANDERDERINLLRARQAPGFRDARQIIADGMNRRSNAILLDYTKDAVGVRHLIDGVWQEADPWEREPGDALLVALKLLCGLNPEDRRSRQQGSFAAEYMSETYSAGLASQGTETGERVVLKFEGKKARFETYDDLGMRDKIQEQVKELLNRESGFFLFSGMPASGLRSTVTVALLRTDRFMRELTSVEEETNRYEEIENVEPVVYSAAKGQTPDVLLPDLFLKEPNVVVIRDLVNARTVSLMCQEVAKNRLLIGSVRAKDSAEALLRVLVLGVPPAEFARAVIAVLCQRLIRKLCEDCKEAYAPTPQVLQQLQIPEGRVQAFYRPPQEPEEVCPECGGIGYLGRTAVFELLVVDDTVRKVLATNPKMQSLRLAARQAGMRTFQEEGILLVAKGVTSLPELMRVLRQ